MEEPGTSRPPASGTAAGDFPELLGFCARAEALIAELLLLSDRAPPMFADRRFDPVLFDFRYFDSPGDFEARIEGNIELEALEDQLGDSCGSYMQRFFSFLDGAVTYHGELCNYLNDLQVKILYSSWGPLVEELATIGQLQLLRTLITFKLRSACKIKAKTISSVLEVLVSSLSVQKGKLETGEEDQTVRFLLDGIKEQQNFCGLFSPLQVIYISEEPPMFLTRLLSLFSISQLSRYVLDVHLGNLTSPLKRSTADFSAVIIGLGTLLRQFDSFYMTQYIQFMVQYIRTTEAAFIDTSGTHKGATHSSEKMEKREQMSIRVLGDDAATTKCFWQRHPNHTRRSNGEGLLLWSEGSWWKFVW